MPLLASLKNYQSAKDAQLALLKVLLALFRIAFNIAKMETIALQNASLALISNASLDSTLVQNFPIRLFHQLLLLKLENRLFLQLLQ
jgi:hypothetical protein